MPRLAVLGHPVAHSRSPAMQNAALAALGLGEEWSYEAIDVAPGDFEERLRGMAAEGFLGANVTIPHKQAALALADVPSEVAQEVGAANTLVFAEGQIQAQNTDADGFLAALPELPDGKRALVLGAGGAARAVVWALERTGARVEVWNRTSERAERLCRELGGLAIASGASGGAEASDGAPPGLPDQPSYDLIVNTSAAGFGGEDPFQHLPLAAGRFSAGQTVVDMVYGDAPSPLLGAARAAGATVVDGLEILVQQGALSLQLWTDREPPLDIMRAAAHA
jgi:shikimate dehydrogenase